MKVRCGAVVSRGREGTRNVPSALTSCINLKRFSGVVSTADHQIAPSSPGAVALVDRTDPQCMWSGWNGLRTTIVDEHIDPSELGDDIVDELLDAGVVPGVDGEG